MKRRWIYPREGEPFEVTPDYVAEPMAPMVFGDTPSYQSPVTGQWVDGRRARREDLKRTQSRPYEGFEQESKEAARHRAYADEKVDASLTRAASEAFYQLDPRKRDILRRGK